MFHPIFLLLSVCSCSSICLHFAFVAALNWANWEQTFVRPKFGWAEPEFFVVSACDFEWWRGGAGFDLPDKGFQDQCMSMEAGPSVGPAASQQQQLHEEVDRLVRQRVEQALGSVFGKVLSATERAAQAAETQAVAAKSDGLIKALKVDVWKPTTREEELRTWREWYFQLSTWLAAHDSAYETELNAIDVDVAIEHFDMVDEVQRSQKLYGVLCSVLRNRPLLLIRGLEKEKAGYEAVRLLKREMEPRERARSLAIVRQLAAWEMSSWWPMRRLFATMRPALDAPFLKI